MASLKESTRRRLLITGSSGRLGSAVARHLSAEHDIVQLDVLESPTEESRGLGPEFQGSIKDVCRRAALLITPKTALHRPGSSASRKRITGLGCLRSRWSA